MKINLSVLDRQADFKHRSAVIFGFNPIQNRAVRTRLCACGLFDLFADRKVVIAQYKSHIRLVCRDLFIILIVDALPKL